MLALRKLHTHYWFAEFRLTTSIVYRTGIGPEAFAFISADGNYTGSTPSASDLAFYNEHGFYLRSGREYYYSRPEVIESQFYAWRATGDIKYYNRAVSFIESINSHLRTPTGSYAPIENVDSTSSDFIDDLESFWFAETLKYLYLIFDDPDHISIDKCECSPIYAVRAPV